MTGAGERNQRAAFQRNAAVRSPLGGKTAEAWQPLFTCWASVRWGTSAERRAAAGEQAVQTATFRVLASTDARGVLVTDRIVHNGLNWDITDIVPIGGPAPRKIEFTATASRN
jgi:SPP1 family predicted phage head-tail adaptor